MLVLLLAMAIFTVSCGVEPEEEVQESQNPAYNAELEAAVVLSVGPAVSHGGIYCVMVVKTDRAEAMILTNSFNEHLRECLKSQVGDTVVVRADNKPDSDNPDRWYTFAGAAEGIPEAEE